MKGSLNGLFVKAACVWDARGMPSLRGPTKDAQGKQHPTMVRL